MGGAKPWQIAIIVLAVLAATASAGWMVFNTGVEPLPTKYLVDVENGELYHTSEQIINPAPHPDTKRFSLYRVYFDKELNAWMMPDRDLPSLKFAPEDGVEVRVIDVQTGRVDTSADPKKYRKPELTF